MRARHPGCTRATITGTLRRDGSLDIQTFNTDMRPSRALHAKSSRVFVLFVTRFEGVSRFTGQERAAKLATAAAAAADSRRGRMQGQRGEKKQPTSRGGDKRETAGETFPSPSDSGRRRKRGKKDGTAGEGGERERKRDREDSTERGEAERKREQCTRVCVYVKTTGAGGGYGEKEVRQSR